MDSATRISTLLQLLACGIAVSATGCDQPAGRPGASPENPARDGKADGADAVDVVDVVAGEVAVLSAEVGGPMGVEHAEVDPGNCMRLEGGFSDCTEALEIATGLPSLHEIIVDRRDGNRFDCRLLRVRTVSPAAAVEIADGIGFSYQGYGEGSEERFVDFDNLERVAETTLVDGTPAEIHEFVGVAGCWMGDVETTKTATYDFKPYVGYLEEDGTLLRKWDQAENDYRVGNGISKVDNALKLLE